MDEFDNILNRLMQHYNHYSPYIEFDIENMGNMSEYFHTLFGADPVFRENYYIDLKDVYELRPIRKKDFDNIPEYSHLYKDGNKISDNIFRKGGMCLGFIDGYCQLILYNDNFEDGKQCIVNKDGEIVLTCDNSFENIHHYGKNLAKKGDKLYNLSNGKFLMKFDFNDVINGENFIIIEHKYNDSILLKKGIYKIDKINCKIDKIDDIK